MKFVFALLWKGLSASCRLSLLFYSHPQPLMEIAPPATSQHHGVVWAALQDCVLSKVCAGCGQTYGTDSVQILNLGIINW